MDRKHLGIIASALVLVISVLWLTQGDDEGAQAASSSQNAIPAAGSSSASANPSALPGKSGNGYASTQQNERYATHLAQADQARSTATSPARNNTSSSNAKNSTTPFETPVQTRPRIKPAPLEPRAEPYALMANSGSATVRFSVRLIGDADPSTTVYLRQSGAEGAIALNDQGVDGDIVARDNIHGGNIVLDTSRLQPDTCLSYIATLKEGESEAVSSPFNLCVSAFPIRAADSNTAKLVEFADGSKAIADELIFTTRKSTNTASIRRLASDVGAIVVGSIPSLSLYQLKLPAPVNSNRLLELVAILQMRPEVRIATANVIGSFAFAPNDPEYASQHGLQLIRAQDVWDIGANGGGVIVTVLDNGLDRSHPDFGLATTDPAYASPADCQLAENDCIVGVNDDTGPKAGHGTQVAGVIAAKTNNNSGVAGIAYGSKIHSIRVDLNVDIVNPLLTFTRIATGFDDAASYIASHGTASIINASFSFPSSGANWDPICAAINNAVLEGPMDPVSGLNTGIARAIVVNAVGNNGTSGYYYPARCNDFNPKLTRKDLFITVANSASVADATCGSVGVDQRCSTSNYGAWADIAAPGTQIRTTTLVSAGSYASPSGTSFSAPMVSGAAAILKSCGVPLDQIESTLRTSANVTVPFPDGSSAPRLDIYRALAQVNHTPTAVGLTNSSLNENTDTTAGVNVGVLVTTDGDTCDKYSYSIAGGADSAAFSIDTATGTLRLSAGVLNYEAKASYAVTVRVTDYFGATFDQALTVSVNNVNEPPVIGSQTFSVNEGSANGSTVGTVSASDPDAGDTKTFSITAGNTGNAFAISPTTGAITVNNTLSYATTPTYALTVRVTDSGGLFASATVTVNVNSVAATNHAPSISAQTFSVSESSSNGTALGTVNASDPDGDSLSYSLTAGNTGGAFALNTTTGALSVGNSTALSYATTPSYALTVQVTDTGSLSASATMAVNVSAASAPAPTPTPTPPPAAPPASGGGGGCSVMAAGGEPDSSLPLVIAVLLMYVWRRRSHASA